MANIPLSRSVEKYIRARAGISECLRQGLVNHRALARTICRSAHDNRIAAAQMAVGRLARRMKRKDSQEAKIARQMQQARILTRSNMMSVILRSPQPLSKVAELQREVLAADDELTVIHGMKNVTLILGQEHRDKIRRLFGRAPVRILSSLVKVQILISEEAERMHGFSAFLYGQISAYGVNLVQELTSAGEYLILIEEKDLPQILHALKPFSGRD